MVAAQWGPKGQWVAKPAVAGAPAQPSRDKGLTEEASYTRYFMLELSPLCGMAVSPSASKKIDLAAAGSSPWIVSGSLCCVKADLVPDEEPEAQVWAPLRPRAASDHVRPGKSTTLVLKNIPKEYKRTGLCEELAAHGFGYAIDFLYLPMDSATGKNLGHAFVNVRTKDSTCDFVGMFQDVPTKDRLKAFPSEGVLQVACSDVQGREANMRKFCTLENLKSWLGHEEWEPLFLDDFGIRIPLEPALSAARAVDRRGSCDGQDVMPWPRQCVSAKTTPMLAPRASPMLGISSPPGLPEPDWCLDRAASEPSSDGTTAADSGEHGRRASADMKASAPEFVPGVMMSSPQMRCEAAEFVPLEPTMEPMMVMLPDAVELGD